MIILPPVSNARPLLFRSGRRAFTLIEIMVVIGIIGIVASVGIPSMVQAMKKSGMRKAMSDVEEGFNFARSAAIFSGQTAELVIHPKDGSMNVNATYLDDTHKTTFSAKLPPNIKFELLGVNFVELQDAEEVRVKFHPNGTCDECALVILSDSMQRAKFVLDVVTGLPDLETFR